MDGGPRYPDVTVRLTSRDGNVFYVIGRVAKALRNEVGRSAADEFLSEAWACESYDEVLRLVMRTVDVE